jgi:hypothetical protein
LVTVPHVDPVRAVAEYLATESALAKATGRTREAEALRQAAKDVARGRYRTLDACRRALDVVNAEKRQKAGGRPKKETRPPDER